MNTTNPLALFRIADKIEATRAEGVHGMYRRQHARTERLRMRDEAIAIWQERDALIEKQDNEWRTNSETIEELARTAEYLESRIPALWEIENSPGYFEDYADLIDTQECARC